MNDDKRSIESMAGRVVLDFGCGELPGRLELITVAGKRHAYVYTDLGTRIHLPFAPHVARQRDGTRPYAEWYLLGTKQDHTSGDTVTITYVLRMDRHVEK